MEWVQERKIERVEVGATSKSILGGA